MTTSEQLQLRSGTLSQVIAMTPAQAEVVVDTTDNRACVGDGSTAGGWPAAKLAEIGGGFLNKFRNGTMDVWQRGTSALTATTSGAYTADGWIVLPTGASVTAAQAGGRLLTKASLQVTGASSVTDVIVKQRIESLMAAAFCSQTVTVQAQVYNNTGGAITPKLTVNRPSAQDNYTSVTADVNAVSLQACGNAAWTLVSYTFAANAASYNGLEIAFDFGNNFGSSAKSIQIAECDIRVTNGIPSGITPSNFIPPPELRPVGIELVLCQRYFSSSFGNGVTPANDTAGFWIGALFWYLANAAGTQGIAFPTPMRTAPGTITLYSSTEGTPTNGQWQAYIIGGSWASMTGSAAGNATVNGFLVNGTATGTAGSASFGAGHWTASSEI